MVKVLVDRDPRGADSGRCAIECVFPTEENRSEKPGVGFLHSLVPPAAAALLAWRRRSWRMRRMRRFCSRRRAPKGDSQTMPQVQAAGE
ncbi:hypothetical protein OG698_00805 [Streptomyces sp. NBC_01003]|nr:hypothetical protein OG698_00805 [Streptomyces sp. NBC_01003]